MALNAQDTSPSPSPLYTIPPNGQGEYGYLAVDSDNYLFAIKYFSYSAKLSMFAPGSTKASVTCLFSTPPIGMYVAKDVLYLTQADDTIVEYAEPLSASQRCSHPIKTLTDERAKRLGSKSLYGLMVDPFGNIFDVWQASQNEALYMDEFNAGSNHAHSFFALHDSYETFMLTSDHNGNVITNVENYLGSPNDAIAVILHGTKTPQLFYPIGDSGYGGLALGKHDGELFAFRNYPTGAVHVYGYNAKTGNLGSEKRAYSGIDGGSIACSRNETRDDGGVRVSGRVQWRDAASVRLERRAGTTLRQGPRSGRGCCRAQGARACCTRRPARKSTCIPIRAARLRASSGRLITSAEPVRMLPVTCGLPRAGIPTGRHRSWNTRTVRRRRSSSSTASATMPSAARSTRAAATSRYRTPDTVGVPPTCSSIPTHQNIRRNRIS